MRLKHLWIVAVASLFLLLQPTWSSVLDNVVVVNLRSDSPSGMRIAVQAAAGLYNRDQDLKVFTVYDDNDVWWLSQLLHVDPSDIVEQDATFFLVKFGIQYKFMSYNLTQTALLPTVVTLAGVLDLVPITQDIYELMRLNPGDVALNVTGKWSEDNSGMEGVKYSLQYLSQTTSLAIQPGATLAQGHLIDWIVKERLFTTYLEDGCIPFTEQHTLLQNVVNASAWERPVKVYGYNSQHPIFGGDLFEAETNCINTLGQIATEHARNLAFWSTQSTFGAEETLLQKPAAAVTYNSSKTYVALVYGDMDNIDISQSFGKDHMVYRASQCKGRVDCFPLTWTISPNLIDMAPLQLRWFYDQASASDWFIMPPSGTLYAYPGQMPTDVQHKYIARQNAQAKVLNSSGSVHWEFMLTWQSAFEHYFPMYADSVSSGEGVHAFFLNNAPWVFPIWSMFITGETYRFYGNAKDPDHSVVVFKPAFNWCANCPSGGLNLTASQAANMINSLPAGSVQYVYVIQNTDLKTLFELPQSLDEHVQLVGYQQLVQLARLRG
eukprot:TRINITY_DN785_c0_g1_i1.p1 TRINITY_DN785_c0_g1~~TRINITY_DN785_c0_g1_i1.p1  ORF type:complete len:549 (-),score=135.53 TRINITY_DN785_c0_g1_i1:116-1762(-)